RMLNIRRLVPSACRLEASLSRPSRSTTIIFPRSATVPRDVVSTRPLSLSATVWKKQKEIIDRDAEEEDDDGLPQDYKKKTLKVGSRRLDTFVAKSAGVPSSQAEKLVLSGRVRVNDEKTSKKAYNVQQGDAVDIWQEVCEDNADFAYAIRTEVKSYDVTNTGYDIHVHSWKRFLVDNWR
ncbi:hypothetical protein PFISCL1PPCAC_19301, partial [Pristionchus fissidentatus]